MTSPPSSGRAWALGAPDVCRSATANGAGEISFGAFDASVHGLINHVRYADSWRPREQVLSRFPRWPEKPRPAVVST